VVFNPPPLTYKDRSLPVTWTIKVKPATPEARLPQKLTVEVKIINDDGPAQTYKAQSIGGGDYKVKVTPVPRDPARKVELDVQLARGQRFQVEVKDDTLKVGGQRFLLSDLRVLIGGASPRAVLAQGGIANGPIVGLGKVKRKMGSRTVTVDLNDATQIAVRALDPPPPVRVVAALVEVKQGNEVLANVVKKAELAGAPRPPGVPAARVVANGRNVAIVRPGAQPAKTPRNFDDEGIVKLEGMLDVDGAPRNSAKAIRPPKAGIAEATLGESAPPAPTTPDAYQVGGTIADLAVGGGGRFLFLTLKEPREVAVFDVNEAKIIKRIPLAADHALVTAGAKLLVIAYPDHRMMERWNLETLTRQGTSQPSPIRARLLGLAMGCDSNGPALALWAADPKGSIAEAARISFLDPGALKVLKVGSLATGGLQGPGVVSTSGGSVQLNGSYRQNIHLRASAGGDVFALWHTGGSPIGVQILSVSKAALRLVYNHETLGYLAPGPDGQTVYTGLGGRRDADGKPVSGSELDARSINPPEPAIPSPDPAFYLSIRGLGPSGLPYRPGPAIPGAPVAGPVVAASVHAVDGAKLLTVAGLNEMRGANALENNADDFTIDKRFHLVPAAKLLITVPPSNDRLVLRRLDIVRALDKLGTQALLVTSPSSLRARAETRLEHQVEARSKSGGLKYTLADGPDGLKVAPDGKVTWTPPKEASGQTAKAIVTIVEPSGREQFHTLMIRVD
jgi:hypothetical protein